MRAIWKGYLKCSLVTIPIRMYRAVTRTTPQFHLYHEACGSRIRQENVCPVCNRALDNDEMVRGYQYGKDLHVVITDADLQKARPEATDTMEILKFVDDRQISPIYYTDAHYLAADGKAGAEALAIFHQAMAETQKSAVARVVMRQREYLLNISPYNGVFVAFTLHYPQELLPVQEIQEAGELQGIQVKADNLEMAKTIIQHLSGDFVPEEYRDEYTRTLQEIIRAKAAGQELKVEPKEEREKVVNLMEALKRSVAATEPGAAPKKPLARAGREHQEPRKRKQA